MSAAAAAAVPTRSLSRSDTMDKRRPDAPAPPAVRSQTPFLGSPIPGPMDLDWEHDPALDVARRRDSSAALLPGAHLSLSRPPSRAMPGAADIPLTLTSLDEWAWQSTKDAYSRPGTTNQVSILVAQRNNELWRRMHPRGDGALTVAAARDPTGRSIFDLTAATAASDAAVSPSSANAMPPGTAESTVLGKRVASPLPRVALLTRRGHSPPPHPRRTASSLSAPLVEGQLAEDGSPVVVREALQGTIAAKIDFLRSHDVARNQFFQEVIEVKREKHARRRSGSPAGRDALRSPSTASWSSEDSRVSDGLDDSTNPDIIRRNIVKAAEGTPAFVTRHRSDWQREHNDRIANVLLSRDTSMQHRETKIKRHIDEVNTRVEATLCTTAEHIEKRKALRVAQWGSVLIAFLLVPKAVRSAVASGKMHRVLKKRGSLLLRIVSQSIAAVTVLQRWWRRNKLNIKDIRMRRSCVLLRKWFRSMNIIKVKFAVTLHTLRKQILKIQRHFRAVRVFRRLRRAAAELALGSAIAREIANVDKAVTRLFKERTQLEAKLQATIRSRKPQVEQQLKDNQTSLTDIVHRKTLLSALSAESRKQLVDDMLHELILDWHDALDDFFDAIQARRRAVEEVEQRFDGQSAAPPEGLQNAIEIGVLSRRDALRKAIAAIPAVPRPSVCVVPTSELVKDVVLSKGLELGQRDYRQLTSRMNATFKSS